MGKVLRRVEMSVPAVYPLPLEICVADTQGGMGYMIAQCLSNELHRRGLPDSVTVGNLAQKLAASSPSTPTESFDPLDDVSRWIARIDQPCRAQRRTAGRCSES